MIRLCFAVCLALLLLAPLTVGTAHAANSYQVNNGATVVIDEFGVCKSVTNNHSSGAALFVPTNTATEWSTFRSNVPAGVTLGCCGTSVGGYCWFAGNSSQSCNDVCSTHGGYDSATKTYAGSGGSNSNCQSVLQALGIGSGSVTSVNLSGFGCMANLGARQRDKDSTSAGKSATGVSRACACLE